MAGAPRDDDTPELAALRRLVAEIGAGDYRDRIGHPLRNNTAYLGALALVQVADLLERDRGSRTSDGGSP